jgi:hypothetical protein
MALSALDWFVAVIRDFFPDHAVTVDSSFYYFFAGIVINASNQVHLEVTDS